MENWVRVSKEFITKPFTFRGEIVSYVFEKGEQFWYLSRGCCLVKQRFTQNDLSCQSQGGVIGSGIVPVEIATLPVIVLSQSSQRVVLRGVLRYDSGQPYPLIPLL